MVASFLPAMCLLSFSTNFAAETNFLPDQDLQKKAQTLRADREVMPHLGIKNIMMLHLNFPIPTISQDTG